MTVPNKPHIVFRNGWWRVASIMTYHHARNQQRVLMPLWNKANEFAGRLNRPKLQSFSQHTYNDRQ